jgi:hypothetical protein
MAPVQLSDATTIIAALILAAIISVVFAALRRVAHAATGKLSALPLPSGAKSQSVSIYVDGDIFASPPSAEKLAPARSAACVLHGKPFKAMSVLKVSREAGILTIDTGSNVVGKLYLPGCEDCLAAAATKRGFRWTRNNVAVHPVWATADVSPRLVGDDYVEVEHAAVAFPWDGGAKIDLLTPASSASAGSGDSAIPAEAIAILNAARALLSELHIAPGIPESALVNALRAVNTGLVSTSALQPDDVVALFDAPENPCVFTRTAVYYDAGLSRGISRRYYKRIEKMELLKEGAELQIERDKVSSPYFKAEKKKAFATTVKAFIEAVRPSATAPD